MFTLPVTYTKAITRSGPINGFKGRQLHFVLFRKQGNEIEGVVLNSGVCIFRIFCPKQG